MKNRVHMMACSATIAVAMVFQVLCPSIALAAKMTNDEPEIAVETSAETSESSDETSSVDVTEPSDTSSDYTYVVETEDLTETEATEPSSDETEVISSATDADPTDVTVDETVLADETEETELTEETEEIEYVVFDHYFTEIDDNRVNTTELFVITSDSSVFTRNTNVVSNYDDAYIIECSSVEEARFVYSYYIDKVEFITDMSDVASIATDDVDEEVPAEESVVEETEPVEVTEETTETVVETDTTEADETSETTIDTTEPVEQEPDIADLSELNNGNDAIANLNDIDTVHNDYSGYIALIDTGTNAHANFTVLDGDVFDHNGHGSAMFGFIRDENPLAQVVSIKVSEDGSASAADIYAGFRLAIDLNVSVINFSMTAVNIEKNAVIREIIQEALDAGIVVIGAAGNNAISATNFIPGCIDGVITIGAVDEYGTKIRSSNYNADYYVVADSTSEATARYTGLYTAGLADISIKVFDQVEEDDDYLPDDYAWASESAQLMTEYLQETYGYGYVVLQWNDDGTPAWRFVMDETATDGFVVAARQWDISTDATTDLGEVSTSLAPGTYNGTCTFTNTNSGKGYVSAFDNAFGAYLNSVGAGNVGFICSKYFSEVEDSSDSAGATSLESGTVYYQAVCTDTGSGRRILITISDRSDMSQPDWSGTATGTQSYTVRYSDSQHITIDIGSTSKTFDLTNPASQVSAAVATYINGTIATEYSGKKGVTVTNSGYRTPPSGGSSITCTATYTYNVASGSQVYAGLVLSGAEERHGAVSFQKVDGNNNRLSGATIYFVCTDGEGIGHESDLYIADMSKVASASTVTYNGRLGIQFETNGNLVRIEGLSPNSTYMFYEAVPPTNPDTGMPYDRAPSVYVITDANGNATPATVTMTDRPTSDGNFGSYSITKTWTAASETSNYFWDSVEQINFGMYAIGWTADNIRQYVTQTSNPLGGVDQLANGHLTEPSTGNSATVWWELIGGEGTEVRHAEPEYWQCWGNCGQGCGHDPGWHRWSELNRGVHSFFVGLPRESYFVATESWTSYMMDGSVEDYYIATLNNSGWRDIGGGNGSHRYVAIYYIGRNGVTYMCDWDTLQPIYALSLHQSPSGRYFDDEYYYDIVDNEEATGSLDVVKIDETDLGVEGVRFELRSGDNPNNLLGNGYLGNVTGQVNGHNTYDVRWNYTLIKPGYIRWQYPWGTNSGEGDNDDAVHLERQVLGPAYNIRDLCSGGTLNGTLVTTSRISGNTQYWTGNQFLSMYQDYLQWRADGEPHVYNGATPINSRYLYNHSNDLWYGIAALRSDLVPLPKVFPVNFGLGPNFNIETGNLNEIRETDAPYVSHLNYGDYYIYEYIEDANGNNIIGAEGYSIPSGWRAWDNDTNREWHTGDAGEPEYFYIRVTVTEDHYITPLTIDCANTMVGKIDVTKINLTGGPLSDLSFEIRDDSNTVIATGYIPTNAEPQTTGTGTATDYTYSAVWDYTRNGTTVTGKPIVAGTGYGTFTVREYVPVSAVDAREDLDVSGDWTYGGVTSHNGVSCYFYTKTVVIDTTNASELQTVTITNAVSPEIGTTLTDFADRHITVVGENIEFTDVVAYEGAYINANYVMQATLVDANGNPLTDRSGSVYQNSVPFTTSGSGSGTVSVSITVNTADLVEAVQNADGTISYAPRSVVCFESMRLVGVGTATVGPEVANHKDTSDTNQTVTVPNPEVGTTFSDLQTLEHSLPTGRIVEVIDTCSFTNLHAGEHYSFTCFLYDQSTGEQLKYSDGTPVVGLLNDFVPQAESGTVDVRFTIDTSDLIVNVFQYTDRTLVAFEYLRSESGILIGGHADLSDLAQYGEVPTPPPPRSLLLDNQTGTHEGVIGASVPVTDTVWYTNLNIGESFQIRGYIVDRDDPSIVYATQVVDFTPTERNGTVEVPFVLDTSQICEGNREAYVVCFEEIWQLDTQNTGRGEVRLARHADIMDQDQQLHLKPECGTQMHDAVTMSNYGMIGEDVEFVDVVAFYSLHIGERYEVTGVLMDKQTGMPVLDENNNPVTASTSFVAESKDGTVEVTYHVNTLRLIGQVGQNINGVVVEAPREIVSFETITSSSHYDFAIHADINDGGQTIVLGDICSGAGDTQTSTSLLAAGMTTVRDVVHYRGLGPVEYELRGSLHYVNYDANGQPVDGGLVEARAGETTSITRTWTPSTHEGDVTMDFRVDTTRLQGQNIIVFEELYYGGVCIISHEHYCDSNGNYGMFNLEQTVRVASVHTNAYSFQTGAQMVARDTQATINDFVYYGNVEYGQYYVEGTLWGCYKDENGYIHSVQIPKEQGGQVTSAVFTANESSGVVEVQFTIDSTTLEAQGFDYIVVTERLIHVASGICVANHSDLSDQAQTIMIPGVRTTATTDTGKTLAEGEMPDIQRVTVRDRVYYENLVCDGSSSYTVVGNLQYAKTDANGNITESGPLIQNGQPVTNSVTFVPTSPTGYIDIEFTVDVSDIMAHEIDKIVVFEDLYYGPEGVIVATHADITDEDQTIDLPGTPTPTPPETPPKTGDNSGYANFVAGAIVAFTLVSAGLSLLMILNRKKDNKKKK